MKGKRGQGLSTTAIVLIVLGVLILVFLIIGFTLGWKKILPWLKPSDNVKDISDSCNIACTGQVTYDYCTKKRDLVTEETTIPGVNCNFLSRIPKYGIVKCPAIECEVKIAAETKAEVITDCENKMANLNNAQKIKFCDDTKVEYIEDNELKTQTCKEAGATLCP